MNFESVGVSHAEFIFVMPLPKKLPLSSNQSKSDVPAKPKEVLANRYRVEKTLGKGNCGTALLVFDIKAKEERDKQ